MNPDWDILGIGPTDDRAEIRRAYSKALRKHRPDTDPKGFQHLREAYERILQATGAKTHPAATDPVEHPDRPPKPMDPWAALTGVFDSGRAEPASITEEPQPVDSERNLLTSWDALWSDPESRMRREAWLEFLADESWWDLQARHTAEEQILSDLESQWGYMERRRLHLDAPHLLDLHFDWWNRQRELATRFVPQFVDELMSDARNGGLRNGASLRYGMGGDAGESDRFEQFGKSFLRLLFSWPVMFLLLMLVRACAL